MGGGDGLRFVSQMITDTSYRTKDLYFVRYHFCFPIRHKSKGWLNVLQTVKIPRLVKTMVFPTDYK